MKNVAYKWWQIGGAVAVLMAIPVAIGYMMGNSASKGAVDHVKILWPDFMSMPDSDRALLAQLSLNCNLHREPSSPVAITNCLRNGAIKLKAERPESHAIERLEILLKSAK